MTDNEITTEKIMNIEIETPSMEENHKSLQAIIEALNQDFIKFNSKKIKTAGARVRNNLLNCKKLCDKLRKQIQVEVRTLPVRHRITPNNQPVEVKSNQPVEEVEEVEEKKIEEVKKPRQVRKANKLKC